MSYNYANRYGGDQTDESLAIEAQMRQARAMERIADALEKIANPHVNIEIKEIPQQRIPQIHLD